MSFSTYIKAGTGLGFTTGLITAAYLGGSAEKMESNSSPGFFGAGPLSLIVGVCGAPAGAVAGTSAFFLKKSFKLISSASLPVKIVLATSLATMAAYGVGRHQ